MTQEDLLRGKDYAETDRRNVIQTDIIPEIHFNLSNRNNYNLLRQIFWNGNKRKLQSVLTRTCISAIIPVMVTELVGVIPDEAPLSLGNLSRGGESLLCDLLAFVQANDGFVGEGAFDFYAYGRHYLGAWSLIDGIETIRMTRHSEDAYDYTLVRQLRNPRKPYQIICFDYLTGKVLGENTYGALRGGRAIIEPPMPQAQEA